MLAPLRTLSAAEEGRSKYFRSTIGPQFHFKNYPRYGIRPMCFAKSDLQIRVLTEKENMRYWVRIAQISRLNGLKISKIILNK